PSSPPVPYTTLFRSLQERAVAIERLERLLQREADGRNLLLLLGRQVVQILVHRLAGVNLVLNPVESRHHHRGECEIRIRGAVRETHLRSEEHTSELQ